MKNSSLLINLGISLLIISSIGLFVYAESPTFYNKEHVETSKHNYVKGNDYLKFNKKLDGMSQDDLKKLLNKISDLSKNNTNSVKKEVFEELKTIVESKIK